MKNDSTHVGRTVYVASDHAGYAYRQVVYEWLLEEGWSAVDCGPTEFDEADDFPALIAPAALAVSHNPNRTCAIIFGGSGQGEAMMANRFLGVRATVYYGGPDEIITLSREHNNANILSIGARFLSLDDVKRVVWLWLHTNTSTELKYNRRNQDLDIIPNKTQT